MNHSDQCPCGSSLCTGQEGCPCCGDGDVPKNVIDNSDFGVEKVTDKPPMGTWSKEMLNLQEKHDASFTKAGEFIDSKTTLTTPRTGPPAVYPPGVAETFQAGRRAGRTAPYEVWAYKELPPPITAGEIEKAAKAIVKGLGIPDEIAKALGMGTVDQYCPKCSKAVPIPRSLMNSPMPPKLIECEDCTKKEERQRGQTHVLAEVYGRPMILDALPAARRRLARAQVVEEAKRQATNYMVQSQAAFDQAYILDLSTQYPKVVNEEWVFELQFMDDLVRPITEIILPFPIGKPPVIKINDQDVGYHGGVDSKRLTLKGHVWRFDKLYIRWAKFDSSIKEETDGSA